MTEFQNSIVQAFKILQANICDAISEADGKAEFVPEHWERPGGGGGITRLATDGAILEKGGVNFSAVHGKLPPPIAREFNAAKDASFFASGVSIVMHPNHPRVPIIHMNVRFFELSTGAWWFGGGIDLTPHYIHANQASWFHKELKAICDRHNPDYYADFKKQADDYFFIPHRNETRGVGGIFFDHLRGNPQELLQFVLDVGNGFAPIYTRLIAENRGLPRLENERTWQLIRRGRYVEFNLVYDRGTKFGLQTNGRTESILMSLPTHASWVSNHQPQAGSEEEHTISLLKKGVDWITV